MLVPLARRPKGSLPGACSVPWLGILAGRRSGIPGNQRGALHHVLHEPARDLYGTHLASGGRLRWREGRAELLAGPAGFPQGRAALVLLPDASPAVRAPSTRSRYRGAIPR